MGRFPKKDPDAVLHYAFNWSDWLGDDEIDTAELAIVGDNELAIASESHTATVHTFWLSGGTRGRDYRVRSRVTTTGGRTDDRTWILPVRDR